MPAGPSLDEQKEIAELIGMGIASKSRERLATPDGGPMNNRKTRASREVTAKLNRPGMLQGIRTRIFSKDDILERVKGDPSTEPDPPSCDAPAPPPPDVQATPSTTFMGRMRRKSKELFGGGGGGGDPIRAQIDKAEQNQEVGRSVRPPSTFPSRVDADSLDEQQPHPVARGRKERVSRDEVNPKVMRPPIADEVSALVSSAQPHPIARGRIERASRDDVMPKAMVRREDGNS